MDKLTRILFVGIYDFGLAALEGLFGKGYNIVGVVTKPEAPGGVQPVAVRAREHGFPLLSPESPKSNEFLRQVKDLRPDLTVVAGYHKRIPKAILDIPPLGTINLHAGMLPAYRGPCAWKWAIMNGDSRAGITVHIMTPELDKGDILMQREFTIGDEDTGGGLFHKFCRHGAELLADTLEIMQHEIITPVPQEETRATYFSYPTEQDARIPWQEEAKTIRNLIRGLNPSPGAWTRYGGQRLTIDAADVLSETVSTTPGHVIEIDSKGIIVGTASNNLLIRQLRLDKDTVIDIQDAVRIFKVSRGGCFV